MHLVQVDAVDCKQYAVPPTPAPHTSEKKSLHFSSNKSSSPSSSAELRTTEGLGGRSGSSSSPARKAVSVHAGVYALQRACSPVSSARTLVRRGVGSAPSGWKCKRVECRLPSAEAATHAEGGRGAEVEAG